ncbi:MAG: FCD domain-containing protein [Roseibium sp.]|uniref:FadR/GntR family transcriptional regulator n=1 Tax=Roseibium sp. TaxID=1936156 RepID=UPI003D9C0762
MKEEDGPRFELPDKALTALPTGAVKDTVEHLGHRIALGHYPVGDVLPKEDELVASLRVSRTVIREAVKVLCGKGLVRTARRYGSRVCPFTDWNLLDPDVIRWHTPDCPMTARIFAEASQLRFIFEPEAAALAAVNGSRNQHERILQAARNVHGDYGEAAMIGAVFAFHSTILQATGNLMLTHFQNLIHAVLVSSYASGDGNLPGEPAFREHHIAVALAIRAQEPDAARRKMRDLLNFGGGAAPSADTGRNML